MTTAMIESVARAIQTKLDDEFAERGGLAAHEMADMAARAAIEAMAGEDPARVFWQQWAAKRLEINRSQWLRAAKRALDGDMRDLRLRVELAEAPPVQIVATALSEDKP